MPMKRVLILILACGICDARSTRSARHLRLASGEFASNTTGSVATEALAAQRRAFGAAVSAAWSSQGSAANSSVNSTRRACGVPDSYDSTWGPQEEYCPFCRWCCSCNANDAMDCEHSIVKPEDYGGKAGVVVFCNKCESKCSDCPAFDSMALCPHGDCCDADFKHQPPFNATYGVGAYR